MSLKEKVNYLMVNGLAKRGLVSLLLRGLNLGFAFLVSIMLARLLDVEGYGAYALVFAIMSVVLIPAQLGFPALLVRETAKAFDASAFGHIKTLWKWASLRVLLASLLGAAVVWVFVIFMIDLGVGDSAKGRLTGWTCALLPLLAIGSLRSAMLRGIHRVYLAQFPEDILRPAFFFILLAAITVVSEAHLSVPDAMFMHLLSAALAFLVGLGFLYRSSRTFLKKSITVDIKPAYWWQSARPLMLNSSFTVINRYADILILGVIATLADAGVYRVASQVAVLAGVGVVALDLIAAPVFASRHSSGRLDELQSAVSTVTRLAFGVSLLPFFVFVLWGRALIEFGFGDQYHSAYIPLVILLCGQVVNSSVGPVGRLLSMCGEEKIVAKTLMVSLALNVFMNIILIPEFGAMGAAAATSVSMILWSGCLAYSARRRIGVTSFIVKFSSE